MPPSVVLRTEVPGPRSRELMRLAEEHTPKGLAHVPPIAVARAQGALLTHAGGRPPKTPARPPRPSPARPAIITFERGFHGRTMLALSLTGQVRPYKDGFGPFMPEVYRIPVPYAYRCSDCLETPCERHSPEYLSEIFRAHVAPESVAAGI